MPVNYNLSAQRWLKPADSAGAYAKGFGLGNQAGAAQAQIAMERARLQEASNRTAVEIALKQQQLQKDSMVEAQKLEVAKAYHEQQATLKGQELEQKARMMQEKVKEAASRQMAMERVRNAIASGEDAPMAILKYGAGIPSLSGPSSQALRTLSERKTSAVTPQIMEVDLGDGRKQKLVFNPKTGSVHFPPSQKPENVPGLINSLDKTLQWDATMFGGDTNRLASIQEAMKKKTEGALGGGKAIPAKINPWPSSEKEAVKGQLYQHPSGLFEYDGTHFKRVNSPQSAVEPPTDSEIADEPMPDDTEEA